MEIIVVDVMTTNTEIMDHFYKIFKDEFIMLISYLIIGKRENHYLLPRIISSKTTLSNIIFCDVF